MRSVSPICRRTQTQRRRPVCSVKCKVVVKTEWRESEKLYTPLLCFTPPTAALSRSAGVEGGTEGQAGQAHAVLPSPQHTLGDRRAPRLGCSLLHSTVWTVGGNGWRERRARTVCLSACLAIQCSVAPRRAQPQSLSPSMSKTLALGGGQASVLCTHTIENSPWSDAGVGRAEGRCEYSYVDGHSLQRRLAWSTSRLGVCACCVLSAACKRWHTPWPPGRKAVAVAIASATAWQPGSVATVHTAGCLRTTQRSQCRVVCAGRGGAPLRPKRSVCAFICAFMGAKSFPCGLSSVCACKLYTHTHTHYSLSLSLCAR